MPFLSYEQLDLTRARGFGALPPDIPRRPRACMYESLQVGFGPGAWRQGARAAAIKLVKQYPTAKFQGQFTGEQWVGHMEGILHNQLGPNPFPGAPKDARAIGKTADYLWAKTFIDTLATHAPRAVWVGPIPRHEDIQKMDPKNPATWPPSVTIKDLGPAHNHHKVATHNAALQLEAALKGLSKFMEECLERITPTAAESEWWALKDQWMRLEGQKKYMDELAREAITYIEPLQKIMQSWQPHIDALVARAEDRSAFLATVNKAAKITAAALSALGTVTAGITEILAVAVELGNLAYQTRQQGALLKSSGVKQLENYGNAMDGYAAIMDEVDATIRQADTIWEGADKLQLKIEDKINALPVPKVPVTTKPPAAPAPVQTSAAPRSRVDLGAQVGILLVVLAGAAMLFRRRAS